MHPGKQWVRSVPWFQFSSVILAASKRLLRNRECNLRSPGVSVPAFGTPRFLSHTNKWKAYWYFSRIWNQKKQSQKFRWEEKKSFFFWQSWGMNPALHPQPTTALLLRPRKKPGENKINIMTYNPKLWFWPYSCPLMTVQANKLLQDHRKIQDPSQAELTGFLLAT